MSEFYSLIDSQNGTFVDQTPISFIISAILNRSVIKISETTSFKFHLIINVRVM